MCLYAYNKQTVFSITACVAAPRCEKRFSSIATVHCCPRTWLLPDGNIRKISHAQDLYTACLLCFKCCQTVAFESVAFWRALVRVVVLGAPTLRICWLRDWLLTATSLSFPFSTCIAGVVCRRDKSFRLHARLQYMYAGGSSVENFRPQPDFSDSPITNPPTTSYCVL